jgi:hypothetical protein
MLNRRRNSNAACVLAPRDAHDTQTRTKIPTKKPGPMKVRAFYLSSECNRKPFIDVATNVPPSALPSQGCFGQRGCADKFGL